MSYLNLDFKRPNQSTKTIKGKHLFTPFKLVLFAFMSIAISFFIWISLDAAEQPPQVQTVELEIKPIAVKENSLTTKEVIAIEKAQAPVLSSPSQNTLITKSVTISQGDSLSSVFNKQGINASVLHRIMTEAEDSKLLKTIRSGEQFDFVFNEKQKLVQLNYHPDITLTYQFSKSPEGKFTSQSRNNPLEAIPVYREGVINSSLFLAAANSNIPDNIIMNMVGIFGWDIDFALDIRKGDSFRLIYNELYQDGEKIKTGDILAAEFTNRGTVFQAILYTDPKGVSNYYSPDGKSMRKAFLRNPVKFSRISSRFTKSRQHPIHGFKRPHRGVDYAASKGTPIYSAGNGKVIHRGRKGGYGRSIIIKHGGKYTTLYAHMNSFNRKIKTGSRVKQGQTIGYVGKSGTATGYHLHYEFRVNGTHRNPLTVKLPAAQPINKKYKNDFDANKDKLLNMLKLMSNS